MTKDNMLRKNWHGDPACDFCEQNETINHLFFSCPVAKVVLGVIVVCLIVTSRPNSYNQLWMWIRTTFPNGDKMYMTGLAAVCCSIWKCRNKACFEKNMIKNPCDIIFQINDIVVVLQEGDMKEVLQVGATEMLQAAVSVLQ